MFVPNVPENSTSDMISLIGCIIMPHNLYLHSSLALSRKIDRSRPSVIKTAIYYFNLESFIILFISYIINLSVISTFAVYTENVDLKNCYKDH